MGVIWSAILIMEKNLLSYGLNLKNTRKNTHMAIPFEEKQKPEPALSQKSVVAMIYSAISRIVKL
jgi:hypothetical protein